MGVIVVDSCLRAGGQGRGVADSASYKGSRSAVAYSKFLRGLPTHFNFPIGQGPGGCHCASLGAEAGCCSGRDPPWSSLPGGCTGPAGQRDSLKLEQTSVFFSLNAAQSGRCH